MLAESLKSRLVSNNNQFSANKYSSACLILCPPQIPMKKNLTFKKYITEGNISALVLVRSITTVFKGQSVRILIISLKEFTDFLKISSRIKAIWILYMVKPSQSTWIQRKTEVVLKFKSQHQRWKQSWMSSVRYPSLYARETHTAGRSWPTLCWPGGNSYEGVGVGRRTRLQQDIMWHQDTFWDFHRQNYGERFIGVGRHHRVHQLQQPHMVDALNSVGLSSATRYSTCTSVREKSLSRSHPRGLTTGVTIAAKFRTLGSYVYESNTQWDPTHSHKTVLPHDSFHIGKAW